MRDLKRALREGPKATLISASHLPHRHPFAIGGACVALALTLLGLSVYETQKDVSVLRPQVTQIVEAAAACQPPVAAARQRACTRRIEAGLEACRRDRACRQAFAAVLMPPPGGDLRESPKGGGAIQQPSSTAPQPPSPHHGGAGQGGGHPQGEPTPTATSPAAHPAAPTTPSPVNPPPPSSPPPIAEPPPPPDRGPGPVRETAEAVGGVVDQAGDTAGGLVEDVTGAGCRLVPCR